jgi:solute carrier family 41
MIGLIFAGDLMDEFQVQKEYRFCYFLLINIKHWNIFLNTPELFILLPVLLNLKGNLEMNLAARFSTSVHNNNVNTCIHVLTVFQ